PAYLVPMVVAIALGFLIARGVRLNLARAALICVGALLAFAPQIAIDRTNFGSLSPFPPLSGSQLTLMQVTDGLRYERYESYVGAGSECRRRSSDRWPW